MMHLSRFSEELIIWSSDEFSFIEIGDAFTTGSSIMPQKKNPDVAELTRGKTGRVYGHLMQLLTVLKGIPMAYNKDLQEDKEGIFDTVQTLEVILKLFPDMLKSVKVNKEKMYSAAGEGYINATELANYLVRKGLTFREAHEIVGKAVIFALDKKINLEEISLEDWHKLFPVQKDVFTDELYSMLQIDNIIKNTSSRGGPDPEETAKIIEEESNWLSLNQKGVEKFE